MLSSANIQHDISTSGQLAFLRRVTEDNQFRAELEADPQKALAQFGLEIDSQDVPRRVELPSGNAVRESLSLLESSSDNGPSVLKWFGLLGS